MKPFILQMYKYKRTDFIETDLKSQLMESFDHHMVTMDTMRQEFEKYKTRLGVVRQEKEKARIELLGKSFECSQKPVSCELDPIIIWASTRENLSSGIWEQQRRRPARTSAQSDKHLCYSLIRKYLI